MSKKIFEHKIMPVTQKMYRYAFSILKDSELANDVVQDCLLKIWEKRKILPKIKSYDSWAMRITRNQCYDWVKTNRYTIGDEALVNISNTEETDFESILKDSKLWLEKIMDSLSQKNREIFHLREVEEMTYQEIAEIMSLSLSDVKVSVHRTRQKIKSSFQKIEGYGVAN